jgi:ADP-ribosylglycohydrolase
MLDQFKGCLLGAAIGDALGMARESTPPDSSASTRDTAVHAGAPERGVKARPVH